MAIVKGVPDIVIYGAGAFAIYWFVFRDEDEGWIQASTRTANARRTFLNELARRKAAGETVDRRQKPYFGT